jgi:ABC-type amino acid transport system permease subunit
VFYIDFFRGTPLLVQIFMIYFGVPALSKGIGLSFTFDRWTAAVLALSLNSAAYLAEIVRAGIQSIERGQWEAAESMGLGPVQTMQYVVFPQAFRRMIPPLGNEFYYAAEGHQSGGGDRFRRAFSSRAIGGCHQLPGL